MATRRQSLSLPNMFSMRWRRLQRRLSCLTGLSRELRPGVQGLMPLSRRASRNQAALDIVLGPMADDVSIAFVAQQPLGSWQAAQQGQRPGMVAHLAGCQEEPDGPSFCVGHGVQLGV